MRRPFRLLLAGAMAALGGCTADGGAPPTSDAPPDAAPAVASPPAPLPDQAAEFECDDQSDRGFQRITEVSRDANSSVIRIETNYFGGATDAVIAGMSCLGKLGQERGFPFYVILDSHAVRYGTLQSPGNDWEATIGWLSTRSQDVGATFGPAAEAGKTYPVWEATPQPRFHPGLISSDAWELFSTPHFRHSSPDEPPIDEAPLSFWEERADEAEGRLSRAPPERRSWFLGRAAKSAAMAGRLDSAEAWGREILAQAEPSGQHLHDGHTALGLVAAHRGDLDDARIHLLKSGMTPGSPALASFGPNMSLARELLEAGDREIVLEYFELCRSFWEDGADELDQWERVVRDGGTPSFGGNLLY